MILDRKRFFIALSHVRFLRSQFTVYSLTLMTQKMDMRQSDKKNACDRVWIQLYASSNNVHHAFYVWGNDAYNMYIIWVGLWTTPKTCHSSWTSWRFPVWKTSYPKTQLATLPLRSASSCFGSRSEETSFDQFWTAILQ